MSDSVTTLEHAPTASSSLTPLEIVEALDKHIIGQHKAKRSVAVALRNHYRRRQLPEELQSEVTPKNIIMIGPTGVGKTEIARRLAKLARAPFIKIEATKFTEVGYVGRDVDSIVRDLAQASYVMVEAEKREAVQERAAKNAEETLLDVLLPGGTEEGRAKMRSLLEKGELEDRSVEIEVKDERPAGRCDDARHGRDGHEFARHAKRRDAQTPCQTQNDRARSPQSAAKRRGR